MNGGGGGPRCRRDGFTAAKKGACVAALAKYGTVADACRTAGISTTSFYRHYNKWADFRGACEAALAKAAGNIEILAWERAVTGIEEDVIAYGKKVGTRRKRSDAIFKLILQASNRKKYGAIGRGGETKRADRETAEEDDRGESAGEAAAAGGERRGSGEGAGQAAGPLCRAGAQGGGREWGGRGGVGESGDGPGRGAGPPPSTGPG